MRHPNPEMLLRIAQGDAYCMATEYLREYEAARIVPKALEFKQYLKHPTHALEAGQYTDDTQMSIGIAELLIEGTPSRIRADKKLYAEYFVRAFKRDPRKGYSKKFQDFLEHIEDADEFLLKIHPDSTKNGAAMRAVPLGVLPDAMNVWKAATTNASVTHNTDQGRFSSQAIALISHDALYTDLDFGQIAEKYADFFEDEFRDVFLTPWEGEVVGHSRKGGWDVGVNTVHAVVTLLKEKATLYGILQQIIEWGGDTDSVAAIAWGIASCRMRQTFINDPIPEREEFLVRDLESGGRYGPEFLLNLGAALMRKYGG